MENEKLRLGFNYVDGIGETATERILLEREQGRFASLENFCQRTRLPERLVENLIKAGAFDFCRLSRRNLFWELGRLHYDVNPLELEIKSDEVELPTETEADLLDMELDAMGLSPRTQVMGLYRDYLKKQRILSSQQLKNCPVDTHVTVAGLRIVRQQPRSAKGMVFIALEDEWGMMGIVLRPDIFQQYKRLIRKYSILVVQGIVQRQENVISILVEHLQSLT